MGLAGKEAITAKSQDFVNTIAKIDPAIVNADVGISQWDQPVVDKGQFSESAHFFCRGYPIFDGFSIENPGSADNGNTKSKNTPFF